MIRNIGQDAPPQFTIEIACDEEESDTDQDKCLYRVFFGDLWINFGFFFLVDKLTLWFTLPANYPDVGPEIKILSSENLEDIDELNILDELTDMVPENVGAAMIFTLVSRGFEWINQLKDQKKIERAEEEERKKRELEESERKKFEGTRVSVESFIAWKLKFDSEMRQKEKFVKSEENRKMTGKEMFLTDKQLIDSDLNFPDTNLDGDDEVKVDESLFLEDLALEED